MHFLFCYFYNFIFFFARNLLVNLLIKPLDSSCVLFFLVTIFVGWMIWNKSELKVMTGSDDWKDGEAENDCCVWKSALRLWKKNNHISLFTLPGKIKRFFLQSWTSFFVCVLLIYIYFFIIKVVFLKTNLKTTTKMGALCLFNVSFEFIRILVYTYTLTKV